MANKKFEREQTGREVAITAAIMVVGICFVLIDENAPYTKALAIRQTIGLLIAGVALLYQHHCMHTPLKNNKNEEQNGK
ncbi:MAG: hypothetical protein NC131_12340 [Roseburia sp.]|nr:hypothetical protein [Roseburia sp.]